MAVPEGLWAVEAGACQHAFCHPLFGNPSRPSTFSPLNIQAVIVVIPSPM